MASLTGSPEVVRVALTLNNENNNKFQGQLLRLRVANGGFVSRKNHTGYSISRQLYTEIEASLKVQVMKGEPTWQGAIVTNARSCSSKVSPRSVARKRPGMAAVRRLMFEKNIATNYVLGATWEIPHSVWRALGYGPSNATATYNSATEIIMFHEVSGKTFYSACAIGC